MRCTRIQNIRITGLFLLVSGWLIALGAMALLPSGTAQGGFVFASAGVEITGLVLLFRAHAPAPGDEQ